MFFLVLLLSFSVFSLGKIRQPKRDIGQFCEALNHLETLGQNEIITGKMYKPELHELMAKAKQLFRECFENKIK